MLLLYMLVALTIVVLDTVYHVLHLSVSYSSPRL